MDAANLPKNQSLGDSNEVKYRDCDDMLARRLTGNIPSHVKKPKDDDYKKFITPSGNPMQYVLDHKKSQVLNELEEQKAFKEKEQEERNVRYEEIQGVKDLLKEEEAVWTSKLDNWKQRRRSATFDVRQRSEERRSIMMQQSEPSTPRRRAKTFREMVEDKKKRDAGISSVDQYPSYSFVNDFLNDDDEKNENINKKKFYRGAVSVPNVVIRDTEISAKQSNFGEAPAPDNRSKEPEDSVDISTFTPPSKSDPSLENVVSSTERKYTPSLRTSHKSYSTENSSQSNNKPSFLRNSFQTPAEIQQRKEKRLSAPVVKSHVHTSPVRQSASTASESSEGDTSPTHNLPFSSKRSMWENMAVQKVDKPAQSMRINLSTLLKQDEERLQMNGTSRSDNSSITSSASSFDVHSEQLLKPNLNKDESIHLVHKPKIMAPNYNRTDMHHQSRHDTQHNQHTFEPIHKYGNSPAIKSFSAALPSKPRISSVEEKVTKLKEHENSLSLNVSGLKGPAFSPRRSPRGPLNSLFEDLNISITQKPKCEKGFGFTVRGGDDGRPVVVNTVSPGGAADSCHLHVGDEILAINDVRLSDTLTQDDIVQLIVNSVITGNLSLSVRRYGKSKKVSPRPFWGSTSLDSASTTFPIRINKEKSSVLSKLSFNHAVDNPDHDFHPPASDHHHTINSNKIQPRSNAHSKAKHSSNSRNTNQFLTSQLKYGDLDKGRDNTLEMGVERGGNGISSSNNTQLNGKPSLHVIEWTPSPHEPQLPDEETNHQRHVPFVSDEAKREEEKRKRIEEARAEERRITEQLRKIEVAKLQQQKRRDEDKRKFLTSAPNTLFSRIFNNPSLSMKDGRMVNENGENSVTFN